MQNIFVSAKLKKIVVFRKLKAYFKRGHFWWLNFPNVFASKVKPTDASGQVSQQRQGKFHYFISSKTGEMLLKSRPRPKFCHKSLCKVVPKVVWYSFWCSTYIFHLLKSLSGALLWLLDLGLTDRHNSGWSWPECGGTVPG